MVGDMDLLIKFRVKDMNEYHKILNNDIYKLFKETGIVDSRGIVAIHTYKEEPRYEVRGFLDI